VPERYNNTIPHEGNLPMDDRPDYLTGAYVLAFDTETKGNGDWFDGPDNGVFLATASDYDSDYLYRLDSSAADRLSFQGTLEKHATLVAHNLSYDVHHVVAAGLIDLESLLSKTLHDTERLSRLCVGLNHTPNFQLKTLGKVFLGEGVDESKDEVRQAMKSMGLIQRVEQKEIPDGAFYEVWLAYPELFEKYALMDTRITHDLFHFMLTKLTDRAKVIYDLESEVAKTLIRMEHRGTAINQDKVHELYERYTVELAAAMDALQEANGGEPLDPNKRGDILPFLLDKGVELTDLTDTGEIRVDKWVLERHLGTVPEIGTILEARVYEKFLSTYVNRMLDRDTVHPSFRPMQARTGRMSCANPNMQNIPVRSGPEVREMFVARPGHKLVVCDYSSIELRVLAHYMGDDRLWDIIDAGDPFMWLGSEVFGTADASKWPIPRQPLKNGFYALMYGAGGPKLASTIGGGMTAQEGRELAKSIKAVLGKPYRDLLKRAESVVKKRGFLYTMGGRPLWLPKDDNGRTKFYVSLNSLIQGSAADIMKQGMVDVDRALIDVNGHLLLTVHDELVAEVPTDLAPEALHLMEGCMIQAQRLCTKGRLELKVEGTISDNYGEAK
jgi:DNA polymerase I-like protein with 3'-5' exonuclease and polymerase domains